MTGGEAAVKSLKKEKVEHVFGLIGSATMEMFDALYHEKEIKFIGVRDLETANVSYARALRIGSINAVCFRRMLMNRWTYFEDLLRRCRVFVAAKWVTSKKIARRNKLQGNHRLFFHRSSTSTSRQ